MLVSRTRAMPMLSPAQAQLLLDTVANHRWAVVYRVALELGLRRGEILALRWADIDFERMVLAVTGTMHGHSGKLHRDAPKTEQLIAQDGQVEERVYLCGRVE